MTGLVAAAPQAGAARPEAALGLALGRIALVAAGVQVVAVLALSDEGAPADDRALAPRLAALGVPSFACTPDLFPDMMAAAIRKQDLSRLALASQRKSAERDDSRAPLQRCSPMATAAP